MCIRDSPGFKVEINTAGGIGKYQIFRSEGTHNSYRQHDFIKLPTLIAVKPALDVYKRQRQCLR